MDNKMINDGLDYSETSWKMDKFMPDDPDIQEEYYEILGSQGGDKEQELEDFFECHAEEDMMERYFPEDGTLRGFCEWLVSNHTE